MWIYRNRLRHSVPKGVTPPRQLRICVFVTVYMRLKNSGCVYQLPYKWENIIEVHFILFIINDHFFACFNIGRWWIDKNVKSGVCCVICLEILRRTTVSQNCRSSAQYSKGTRPNRKKTQESLTEHISKLPPVCELGPSSYLILRIVDWYLDTNVWRHRIGLYFKVQGVTLEDWPTDNPDTSVTNTQSLLRNIPEERRFQL